MARIVVLLGLLFTLVGSAPAWAWSEDTATPEGWALARIKAGDIADFNTRCGKTLDPVKPAGWDDACRQVSPQFLVDLLTVPKWQGQVPLHGVRLRGAHFIGDIDVANAEIGAEVWLMGCRMEGGLLINDIHLKRVLLLNGSYVSEAVLAFRIHSDSDIDLRGKVYFADDVNLAGTTVAGDLDMSSATFAKTLTVDRVIVHGGLFMGGGAHFVGAVGMTAAVVGDDLEMDGAVVSGRFDGGQMTVNGNVNMRDKASFGGDTILNGATVGGNLSMDTANFAKTLDANNLHVNGSMYMRDHASVGGDVVMRGARIGGNLEMIGATFAGNLNADGVSVGRNFYLRDGSSFAGEVTMIGTKVGTLQMRSITVSSVDMSDLLGAPGSEFEITGLLWPCPSRPAGTGTAGTGPTGTGTAAPPPPAPQAWPLGQPWRQTAFCGGQAKDAPPRLILRNVHVDAFQDSPDAWPAPIDLEGFHYDRLGGLNGSGRGDMRKRTQAEWIDWLNRDQTYSSQPYTQLASVLMAAGRRDTAEAVLFAGSERERGEIWDPADGDVWPWLWHGLPGWLWLTFFGAVFGYGIGLYTFIVVLWVLGLTLLGGFLLRYSPYARQHSIWWRFGATLHRLLPVVELNKEFEDFFDNKTEPGKPLKLLRWQKAFFSAMALAGFVMGAVLLAAVGGLAQK